MPRWAHVRTTRNIIIDHDCGCGSQCGGSTNILEIALSRNSSCLCVVQIEIEAVGVCVFITPNRSGCSSALLEGRAIHATNQSQTTKKLAIIFVSDVDVPGGT